MYCIEGAKLQTPEYYYFTLGRIFIPINGLKLLGWPIKVLLIQASKEASQKALWEFIAHGNVSYYIYSSEAFLNAQDKYDYVDEWLVAIALNDSTTKFAQDFLVKATATLTPNPAPCSCSALVAGLAAVSRRRRS